MSFHLHAHHVFLFATLLFSVSVLTLDWYTSPGKEFKQNVFQLCVFDGCSFSCRWTFLFNWTNVSFRQIIPLIMASSAVACGVFSLFGLILGSWFIQQTTAENRSTCLRALTMLCAFFSFLFSCGVWSIMLTTNLHQQINTNISLTDLGFSFWLNIGSSCLYLYTLFIHLLANCSSQ